MDVEEDREDIAVEDLGAEDRNKAYVGEEARRA